MNRRRVSELLQAGVAIGPKNLATNSSNPFIQPISEFDNSDTADEGPLPVSTVKAEWMRKRLEESEQEFVMGEDLIIFSGTWNVDGTEVPENFSEWFEFGSRQTPDIVFIGLQEVDRSTQAYIYESSLKEKYWSDAILAKINTTYPGFNFVKVASKLYVGIYAAVFIRDRLIPVVSHVSTSIAACGLMGLVGNKGAVGIRFRVYAEYICFISSHLAAHVPQVERRNQDAAEIGRRLIFNAAQTDYWEELNMLETLIRSFRANPGPASIWESSHLIWAGDLNYRIPLDSSTVRHLSRLGLYDELLQHDQLNLVRCDESSVWAQFEEAPINFAPTFKYDRGTVEFDSSEKERIPAWCDRILFQRDDQLECLDYSAVMQIKSSDHRPVRALFRAKFNRIIPELFTKTYERQLKALDKLENELIPVTLLQCNEIVLETPLVFRRAQTRSVEILNVGQVICQFRFISTGPPGSPICQPWIRIKPIHDILSPGESRQIKLYFLADVTATQKLNQAGGNKIEDILVIHVEGGRDHFVHVTGTFRPTLFCRPLEEICEETVSTHQKTGEMVRTRRVPKPVWIMVDFIIRNGIKTVSANTGCDFC